MSPAMRFWPRSQRRTRSSTAVMRVTSDACATTSPTKTAAKAIAPSHTGGGTGVKMRAAPSPTAARKVTPRADEMLPERASSARSSARSSASLAA